MDSAFGVIARFDVDEIRLRFTRGIFIVVCERVAVSSTTRIGEEERISGIEFEDGFGHSWTGQRMS